MDRLQLRMYANAREMGNAAAQHARAAILRELDTAEVLAIVFAAGNSQLETLRALLALDIPWPRLIGFQLDEYLQLPAGHPASFRRFLHAYLVSRAPFLAFHDIPADAPDPAAVCAAYAAELRAHAPRLCLLGIGENGHLAFNDPGEADFSDPEDMRLVNLDEVCRNQQVQEGHFAALAEVPERAITLTIPAIMRIPELILSVSGPRKAAILRQTLSQPVSTRCPATILRRHPRATVYLDAPAAAQLPEFEK